MTPQRYVKAEEFEALKAELAEKDTRVKELEARLSGRTQFDAGAEADARWRSRIEKLAELYEKFAANPVPAGGTAEDEFQRGCDETFATVAINLRSLLSGPEGISPDRPGNVLRVDTTRDGVTVELTREEAEHAMKRGAHPTNACLLNDFSCEMCGSMAEKLRAALATGEKEGES